MSISGILSNSYNQYQNSVNSDSIQQQFQQLSTALQTGNLSSAQSDFASLKAAFSQPSTTTGAASTTSNTLNQAFNQLGSDLQSGNLSAAQKDLSAVEQDAPGFKDNPAPRFSHNPWNGGGGVSGNPAPVTQNPYSNSLSGAQQAYAALAQQLQQSALGATDLTSESPVSFDV